MTLSRRSVLAGMGAAPAYLALTSREAAAQQAKTMILAAAGTPEGFDGDALRPGTQATVTQVYEGLVRYGRIERDGTYLSRPDQARTPSGREVGGRRTMASAGSSRCAKASKSPFGNELTAADVEWGWNKSFAQKRTGNFIASVANVTAVKALSPTEVEFTLSAPSSIFPVLPDAVHAVDLRQHGGQEARDHGRSVGAGLDADAYRWLRRVSRRQRAAGRAGGVRSPTPNYFRPAPYFGRVIYRAVPSPASRITLLRSGIAQWIERPERAAGGGSAQRQAGEGGGGRPAAP